jgi:hypothetical protein
MIRAILLVAGGMLLSWTAAAEDAGLGRYQIAPDGDGFVRLDTETGALAHCDRSDGVWRCAVVVEDRSEVDRRILALQEELSALRADVDDLRERLAEFEAGEEAQPGTSDETSEEEEKEFDEALSFAERMMRRFFDMIRELKNEAPPQQI